MIEPGSLEEMAFADASALAGFLPYVTEEVGKALHLCDRRAELAAQQSKLTPEVAHLILMERLMWLRLLSRFKQKSATVTATLQNEVPGLTFGAQLGEY